MKRPFRGLRRQPPAPAYDAVVVGAGVGGLVAANLLAEGGLKVLLAEQHYMAGGYCSTFRRGGFTFDAATHFYPLLGDPETLTGRVLARLGCTTEWVRMDPVDTFHLPDGSRFEVPADLETYLARLKGRFPEEAGAIDRFFEEARRAYLLGLLVYFRSRSPERLGPLADLTVSEVLRRFFRDPRLRLVLTADCPHWGSPPERTSFVFDSMLRLSYFLGNFYPVGGSQPFVDDLARCFEERGGDILMSTRCERIVVEDGRAVAVEVETTRGPLSGRRRIEAGAVVSNADLKLTVERLLPPTAVDPAYLHSLQDLRPSYPCALTHLGLEGVSAEALEEAQGYYWKSWDADAVGRDALICKVFAPTLYEPRLAPPGGQIVILQKVLEVDYHAIEDWAAHKAAVERFVFAHLEKVLPGIAQKVVVKTSASALTANRFTLNEAGAMLGWEMSPDQLGAARPGIHGPVDGLYLTGHWVRPGGGITPVIVSAQQAAEAVLAGSGAGRAAPGHLPLASDPESPALRQVERLH